MSKGRSADEKTRCSCCGRHGSQVRKIDSDHQVPRGVGGANHPGNRGPLCRKCHSAKHGDGLAPTIRWLSTGDMDEYEFLLYKQFMNEMIPAVAQVIDVEMDVRYSLGDNDNAWHIPVGDIRWLDERLTELDVEYQSIRASEYW
ncbi:HNH endonuclease [Natronomonas salina]|nr:HNH endonuclease [Natronomonas salina]